MCGTPSTSGTGGDGKVAFNLDLALGESQWLPTPFGQNVVGVWKRGPAFPRGESGQASWRRQLVPERRHFSIMKGIFRGKKRKCKGESAGWGTGKGEREQGQQQEFIFQRQTFGNCHLPLSWCSDCALGTLGTEVLAKSLSKSSQKKLLL